MKSRGVYTSITRPFVPRERASRDIDEAIVYYLGEDAGPAALGFIDALEQAYSHISRHPASGSPPTRTN